jgi:hypothetical protein
MLVDLLSRQYLVSVFAVATLIKACLLAEKHACITP